MKGERPMDIVGGINDLDIVDEVGIFVETLKIRVWVNRCPWGAYAPV